MAVYMQATRRNRTTLVIAVVVSLIVGGAIGYLVGHQSSTSAADIVAEAQSKAEDAATALERLPIEYEQAVTNASGESTTTINEAIDDAAALLAAGYAAAPWLGPTARGAPDQAFERLRGDVGAAASTATFQDHVRDAVAAIGVAFNLPSST
jgi:hypothetical protein